MTSLVVLEKMMIKISSLAVTAIAFGLILVSVLMTGSGALSVFGTTKIGLLGVGGIATAIVGLLMRDECVPGHRYF